jgi:hypothetical protein
MKSALPAGLLAAWSSGRRFVVAAGKPERGMRTLSILCAFTLVCQPKAWCGGSATGERNPLDEPDNSTALTQSVQPAYRFVEGISDGVYDFARLHVAGNLLPDRLNRSLRAAPKKNSAPLFDQNLRDNESRFLARAKAAYPVATDDLTRKRAWSHWVAREQLSVAAGTLTDTLTERYQLEMFGSASGAYAADRRNWDPGFLSMAGVLGGAFLYLNGLHANASWGRLRFGADLSSGLSFQRAVQGDGNLQHLGAFEIGLKSCPVTVSTEVGLASGHLTDERVGAHYKLRF